MSARADLVWMEHSGGTKFYQVIRILHDSGRSVTVTHWGPITPATEAFWRPVNGGQLQMHRGDKLAEKRDAKSKRGYSAVDRRAESGIQLGASFDRGDGWLIERFGAAQAHEIHNLLFSSTAAYTPSAAPETSPMPARAVKDERPEGWGAW